MFDFVTQSPLWNIILISDWISKYLILLGLFILSVLSVSIIIYKYVTLQREKKKIDLLIKNKAEAIPTTSMFPPGTLSVTKIAKIGANS